MTYNASAEALQIGALQEQTHHVLFVHGTLGHLDSSDSAAGSVSRQSDGLHLNIAQANGQATVHLPIPTTLVFGQARVSVRSVVLDFIAGPDLRVIKVQVFDGNTLKASFENLTLTGDQRFQEFEIPGHVAMTRGINVAVTASRGIEAKGDILFIAMGAIFIVKGGIIAPT